MRLRLPNRRPQTTFDMGRYSIAVGFDPRTGKALEVFADDPHRGTEYEFLVSDACTVISIALQYGVPIEALTSSVGRIPAFRLGMQVEIAASPHWRDCDKAAACGILAGE